MFNGNGGVVVLVISVFGIFYLVDSDDGVAWVVVEGFDLFP